MPNLEKVSSLAFALLGLYLLGESVPSALSTVGLRFHMKAGESTIFSHMNGLSFQEFWNIQFPTIVYHIATIGFSLFVFLRGKSLSKFVWSLRK